MQLRRWRKFSWKCCISWRSTWIGPDSAHKTRLGKSLKSCTKYLELE
jgi:hypothetical protein